MYSKSYNDELIAIFKPTSDLFISKYPNPSKEILIDRYTTDPDGVIAYIYVEQGAMFNRLRHRYYSVPDDDKESLILDAIRYGMDLITTRDETKRFAISTVIVNCAKGDLGKYIKRQNANKRSTNQRIVPLDSCIDGTPLSDLIGYMPLDFDLIDLISDLDERLKVVKLSEIEGQVLKVCLDSPSLNQEQMATELGCNQVRVSRTLQRIKQKLFGRGDAYCQSNKNACAPTQTLN